MAIEGNIGWYEAFEDAPVALMDRVRNLSHAYITQASLTSVTYKVYACNTKDDVIAANGTIGASGTLTVSTVVYDTLQTAAPWTKDATGYNLRYDSPGTDRPTGGLWYRYEILITPTSGGAFPVVWGVYANPMAGS